jgi:hypothetical protein
VKDGAPWGTVNSGDSHRPCESSDMLPTVGGRRTLRVLIETSSTDRDIQRLVAEEKT